MFYVIVELVGLIMFLFVLRDAIVHVRKDPKKLALLVLAVVYIVIFENINMWLLAGKSGAYFYNNNFLIFIGNVPAFISLLWASLLYTAIHLTDRITLKQYTKPFLDALAVLLLSLMLDVAFSRQSVRTWIGYSAHHGWFGAPADHLISILFMTFIFSFLFRYFSEADNEIINDSTRALYYFLLPAFAYLAMLAVFSLVNLAEDMIQMTRSEELFMLWALVILFAVMLKRVNHSIPLFRSDTQTNHTILFIRMVVITYVIWSVVLGNVYQETMLVPILLVIIVFAEILLYSEAFKGKGVIRAELEHY